MRFSTYHAAWLQRKKSEVRYSTWADYESVARIHLAPALRTKRLKRITPDDLRAIINAASPGRRNRIRVVAQMMFGDALLEGKIRRNPVDLVKVRSSSVQRVTRVPSLAETMGIAMASPWWARPTILAAAGSGLRWGELAALRWSDVDMKRRTFTVDRAWSIREGVDGRPKSANSHRTAIFHEMLLAPLVALDHERELVFGMESGQRLHHSDFSARAWRPTLKGLGLSYRFHDLRHTYATTLISSGVQPALVAKMMGHSSPHITMKVYANYFEHQLDEVREALTR